VVQNAKINIVFIGFLVKVLVKK